MVPAVWFGRPGFRMPSWSIGGPSVGHRNAELELGGPRIGGPRVGGPRVAIAMPSSSSAPLAELRYWRGVMTS